MISSDDVQKPSASSSEGARTPSFFFIVGCPRSGTTLLRWMLDSHPTIAVTPETHFGERYLASRDGTSRDDAGGASGSDVWTPSGALDRFCASAAFDELEIDERAFRERVADIADGPWGPLRVAMEEFARLQNASIVGEKTPSHSLHLDALAEVFPSARFLILMRDPRAVAASWHRASWSHHSTAQIAETWCRYARATKRARRRMGPRCLEITYEDLVSRPTGILGQICEFLGTEFDSRMLHYHERRVDRLSPGDREDQALTFEPPRSARTDAWHSSLGESDLRQIEAICARPMAQRGYRLETSIRERVPDLLKLMPSSWRKRTKRRLRRRS